MNLLFLKKQEGTGERRKEKGGKRRSSSIHPYKNTLVNVCVLQERNKNRVYNDQISCKKYEKDGSSPRTILTECTEQYRSFVQHFKPQNHTISGMNEYANTHTNITVSECGTDRYFRSYEEKQKKQSILFHYMLQLYSYIDLS